MQPISTRPARRIVADAPAYVSLLGGLSAPLGGKVLGCALAPRATVAVEAPARELAARMRPEGPLIPIAAGAFPADEAAPVRAMLAELGFPSVPCIFRCDSEIPPLAALGAPAATLACLIAAYLLRQREALLPAAQAELLVHVGQQQRLAGCGHAEAYGALYGGLTLIDLHGKGVDRPAGGDRYARVLPLALDVATIPLVVATLQSAEATMDAGRQPAPSGAASPRAHMELAALAEAGYIALRDADWLAFGAILDEHHARCRALLDCTPVEGLIAAAGASGARGASLAGPGDRAVVVGIHPQPERLIAAFLHAGAAHVYRPDGAEGLRCG